MQSQSPHYEATSSSTGPRFTSMFSAVTAKTLWLSSAAEGWNVLRQKSARPRGGVVFQHGTTLDRARYIMCQYDQMHSPAPNPFQLGKDGGCWRRFKRPFAPLLSWQ